MKRLRIQLHLCLWFCELSKDLHFFLLFCFDGLDREAEAGPTICHTGFGGCGKKGLNPICIKKNYLSGLTLQKLNGRLNLGDRIELGTEEEKKRKVREGNLNREGRQSERQADRRSDRETVRETVSQSERLTERETD